MDQAIADIAMRALDTGALDRQALLTAARRSERRPWDLLYWGGEIRRGHFGHSVRLCRIVAGKLGGCAEDCRWCAQSVRSAAGLKPSAKTPVEALAQAAQSAARCGAAHVGIVNSGRRPAPGDIEHVIEGVRRMRDDAGRSTDVCASLGELSEPQARVLAAAGVRRYHHNLETSRRFFATVVSTHSYDDRLATLAAARQAGMQLCSGGLLGMGETWEDRVDLALTLRDEVRPDCVPLNFLHPIPGTALEHVKPPEPLECLRIIALFRLAMPAVDIKVAGGREANLRDLQSWIFDAGASSLMTGDYLTTKGRGTEADLRMIRDLGLTVVGA